MGWNWLDWVLATTVVLSTAAAAWKGFARELIVLAAVAAGLLVAALEYQRAAAWFERRAHSHDLALGLGFLSVFAGVLLVGILVSWLAKKLIQKAGLQFFDRFLGALFGLVRGVAISSVVIMAMLTFSMSQAAVEQSQLAPYMVVGARLIVSAMPGDVKDRFSAGLAKFRKTVIEHDKNAQ